MGRKGKVDTRRKPILQLDENKKSGAKSNKKNPRKEENTAKQKYQPLYVDGGAGEVFDPQEQEKVAAEIETFLKEIVAASKQGKENLGGQTPPDEFTPPETMDTAISSPALASSTMEVPVDMATVSFWQAVVDSKTNSSYYWNPATNEVSWTLPPNSVITNEQPVPALTGTGEAAGAPVGGSLQDYYAYYSQQIYGADASSQVQNAVTEEPKDKNAQMAAVGHTANPSTEVSMATTNGTSTTTLDSPVVTSEAFIGPAPANRNKGSLPNQDSPTVRGEKRQAEESSSPVSVAADSKKAKVQVEKSPAGGRQKQAGNLSATTSSANEQALRFQVSAMADEFMRKLQYLHIGDEGFSPLQVMKIQVETRLEDWKDGGLPSKHLLAKLKEANKMVAEYEISAAPSGWKCVWDSATCRYFYQNTSTGESSWEYPTLSPMSPAHSELSEQPLEQAESSNMAEPVPMLADASIMQDAVMQVPMVTNAAPAVTLATLSVQEPQEPVVYPPPPPTGPPPPITTASQPKDTAKTSKSTTNSVQSEEKALEEVRQKLNRPPRSGGLYSPEDLAAYEEPERPRVQIEASTGMEFISEFPPKQPDMRATQGERADKKKGKSWKKRSENENDEFPLAQLPKESKPSEDVSGWSAPSTAPPSQEDTVIASTSQRGPEAAALVHEPEPLFVLRDSDIEVAQEQVADSLPRKVSDLVGNEYGCVAPELPGTAADFPPNQGDVQQQHHWDQGMGDALGNMLPTPPQEVVVEDQAVYGMEVMQGGNMGGEDDMLQPSDELGYAGSVEVETVEMCVSTSPLEPQDMTYGSQVGFAVAALSQPEPSAESLANVSAHPSGKSLEESEVILRERLLRRVMQQQQQHQAAATETPTHEVGTDGGAADLEDMGGKAPDVGESVELTEYGPEVRLLQGNEDSKFADHSQVGLQLEVSTTVPTVPAREHTTAGREKKDESTRVDIEEEGEIVSTPEKRPRPETPPKTSTGKASASKRDLEREDSKSKSSRRVKKHRSRSRSKSKERHGRRSRKHSDVSDSGDDYSRRSSKRGRKRHDDRSDSEDYHHSRRSRRHSDSDGDRSSSRKDRRHSRSVSRDSKDSRDKSQKRKKKEKKDKKKRHSHHSGSKERSGDDADKKKNSTPQNIIVGKVGSLGSIRQLGQEKKAQATTPQPEQTPPGFQPQQPTQQGDAGQGTGYYPQTSYMYGGYQYPYSSDQAWQGQQGWDQQQGWQSSTAASTATATTTTLSAAAGDQAWSVGTAMTMTQQDWEPPRQQSEELKQHSDQASVPVAAEGHVWHWDDQKASQQQPQPSLSRESEGSVVGDEQIGVPPEAVPAEVQVEVNTIGHIKPGEDQEVVVEETVIDESSDVIEVPTDAEITECDMEIEQMSSEAFLSEKKSRVVVAVEYEKELPPGAETPPATERDKTPSPLPQEPPAVHHVTGSSADTTPHLVQEQPLPAEKPAPEVQLQAGESSGTAQSKETNSPQINGEQGPQTPSKEDTKQDRSSPGTPTTAEAPPPTSSAVSASTPQGYNYGTYAAQTTVPAGYDYSAAYSQAGYDYSQAYSAYVQAAAASMAYASYSQYYANPYAAAFAGYGSPYAAYYQYANAGAFQSPGQQAASPQAQQTDSGKKGQKKEESKGMIEKWNTLQTQYGKPA